MIKSVKLAAAFSGSTFNVTVTIQTTGYGSSSTTLIISGIGSGGAGLQRNISVTGTGSNTFVKKYSYVPPWCSGGGGATTAFADILPDSGWPSPGLVEKPCP
ncbi:MAG: hypothetical protein HOU81_22410 [Hamadaea sp.]|uniref:hypothetical protein n=1 Tax=Hamadaea sp. TaxID=2024425 RepID=UPI0018591C89|nr:hypothetical protein [Hamadaea sp.]NUR73582.1 hypothetical protein [Hamadaea sp.]NUT18247.1 hypothetical protein [Hamadaea sp.]